MFTINYGKFKTLDLCSDTIQNSCQHSYLLFINELRLIEAYYHPMR